MSEMPHENLLIVQDTVAALLGADPYFSGVDVITEKKGDIENRLRAALGKLGLCVVVTTPAAGNLTRKGNRLSARVQIVIECAESVVVNQSPSGKMKPALAAAVAAAKAIDRKPNGLDAPGAQHRDRINEIVLVDDDFITLVPDRALLIYHVEAVTDVLL